MAGFNFHSHYPRWQLFAIALPCKPGYLIISLGRWSGLYCVLLWSSHPVSVSVGTRSQQELNAHVNLCLGLQPITGVCNLAVVMLLSLVEHTQP